MKTKSKHQHNAKFHNATEKKKIKRGGKNAADLRLFKGPGCSVVALDFFF